MAISMILRDMLGEDLAGAIDAAQERLSDETITARCAEGLWLIERAAATVVDGLTYEGAVEALAELE